jgi:hypothetical protein
MSNCFYLSFLCEVTIIQDDAIMKKCVGLVNLSFSQRISYIDKKLILLLKY